MISVDLIRFIVMICLIEVHYNPFSSNSLFTSGMSEKSTLIFQIQQVIHRGDFRNMSSILFLSSNGICCILGRLLLCSLVSKHTHDQKIFVREAMTHRELPQRDCKWHIVYKPSHLETKTLRVIEM